MTLLGSNKWHGLLTGWQDALPNSLVTGHHGAMWNRMTRNYAPICRHVAMWRVKPILEILIQVSLFKISDEVLLRKGLIKFSRVRKKKDKSSVYCNVLSALLNYRTFWLF
jgi:hypothetical protein